MRHALVLAIALMAIPAVAAEPVVDIGSNRELFLDHFLIDQLVGGATLKMHVPVLSNECSHGVIPLGAVGQYSTILHDGDVFACTAAARSSRASRGSSSEWKRITATS